MKYYLYFPVTGIYNGAIDLVGNKTDPQNATGIEPPEAAEGQVAVFADGAWFLMEDNLGTYWNTETKEKVSHIMPGPLPENLTALEPPSTDHQWTGEAWELPLAAAKAAKIALARAERIPLLQALDVVFFKAMEAGKDFSAIAVQKQILRDLPDTIDACETIEQVEEIHW